MQLKVLACYVCYAKFIPENYELGPEGRKLLWPNVRP